MYLFKQTEQGREEISFLNIQTQLGLRRTVLSSWRNRGIIWFCGDSLFFGFLFFFYFPDKRASKPDYKNVLPWTIKSYKFFGFTDQGSVQKPNTPTSSLRTQEVFFKLHYVTLTSFLKTHFNKYIFFSNPHKNLLCLHSNSFHLMILYYQ